jgi:hypothetical protein
MAFILAGTRSTARINATLRANLWPLLNIAGSKGLRMVKWVPVTDHWY